MLLEELGLRLELAYKGGKIVLCLIDTSEKIREGRRGLSLKRNNLVLWRGNNRSRGLNNLYWLSGNWGRSLSVLL